MYWLYSLLTGAGLLVLSPILLVRGVFQRKYINNLADRMGWRFPPELRRAGPYGASQKSIWIHAVSVGEVLAIVPLAQQLKKRFPNLRLVVSTTTNTGQKIARERMAFADAIFYFPLDWRGPVKRAFAAARPALVIIAETEIWPNFLRECRRSGVPAIFVNGRFSERSFRGHNRALSLTAGALGGFLKKVLSDPTLYLMQSREDAARLTALGAPREKVLVTGNLKYDLDDPRESPLAKWLETQLAVHVRRPVIVAGSVLAGEEAPLLDAFSCIERNFPRALLILAPRKPERFDEAASIIAESGRQFTRRSALELNGSAGGAHPEFGSVILLDSIGELAGLYRLADAVFVGGSLVPGGGHNILEPAALSKVPIYGPSMENFNEISAQFLAVGAAIQVKNSDELGNAWGIMVREPAHAARLGAAAREVVARNRGATQNILGFIERVVSNASGRGRT